MTVGERIKKARLEKGYTQLQLAEMIGVAKNTITGYETGTREPDSSRITAIANALNVSGDYIIGTEYDWLPSSAAMKIAAKYDKLDQHGRELIDLVVDHEIRRVQSAAPAQQDKAWAQSRADKEITDDANSVAVESESTDLTQ